MDKKSIDSFLRIQFERRHWPLQRLCYLLPAFSRDVDVSPLFAARPIRRADGVYSMSGYLGLVCQNFERQYLEKTGIPKGPGNRPRNPGCLWLHISNLGNVRRTQYIESESQLPDFCDSVMNYLESMPHSIPALRKVFSSQELLGVPLQYWALQREQKLLALQDYLRQQSDIA